MVKRFSPHGLLPVFCYNEGQKCWDSFISEGILMYFIQLLPPRTKIYPNKCWISYRANNGLCSGTTLNGGGKGYKHISSTVEVVARKQWYKTVIFSSVSTTFVLHCRPLTPENCDSRSLRDLPLLQPYGLIHL